MSKFTSTTSTFGLPSHAVQIHRGSPRRERAPLIRAHSRKVGGGRGAAAWEMEEGRGRHHGRTGGAPPRGSPRRERRRGLGRAAAGLGGAGSPPPGRWRRGGSAAAGEMKERRCAVAGEGRGWRRDRGATDGGGEGVVLPLLVAGEEEGAA